MDFKEALGTGKTRKILVSSRKHGFKLGEIRWYGAWFRYAFFPEPDMVFDTSCMAQISGFIQGLMDARRVAR